MYVLECLGLLIRSGGFTHDIAEAKRYATQRAARRDCVRGWVIRRVSDFERKQQTD